MISALRQRTSQQQQRQHQHIRHFCRLENSFVTVIIVIRRPAWPEPAVPPKTLGFTLSPASAAIAASETTLIYVLAAELDTSSVVIEFEAKESRRRVRAKDCKFGSDVVWNLLQSRGESEGVDINVPAGLRKGRLQI